MSKQVLNGPGITLNVTCCRHWKPGEHIPAAEPETYLPQCFNRVLYLGRTRVLVDLLLHFICC